MTHARHNPEAKRNGKIIFFAGAALVVLPMLWYLVSPLFRVIERDDASPLAGGPPRGSVSTQTKPPLGEKIYPAIGDQLAMMPENMMEKFMRESSAMKSQVIEKSDAMPSIPRIVRSAPFVARAHDVKGTAAIIKTGDGKVLRFENFETVNGPDLRIYLSAELNNKNFVDLGPVRATKGNVNYVIPPGVDTAKYGKVLVWCRAFGVLFSFAELN